MATLAQLRTRVDDWLAARWPTVLARQDTFFANRGRYWQGLITHTVVPAHTTAADADTVADRLSFKPTDQAQSWLDVLAELSGIAFPAALAVDVYDGTQGKGYVATIFVRYNGTIYTRSKNVGPESYRDVAWQVLTSPPVG